VFITFWNLVITGTKTTTGMDEVNMEILFIILLEFCRDNFLVFVDGKRLDECSDNFFIVHARLCSLLISFLFFFSLVFFFFGLNVDAFSYIGLSLAGKCHLANFVNVTVLGDAEVEGK
jgi:hypothetical protein